MAENTTSFSAPAAPITSAAPSLPGASVVSSPPGTVSLTLFGEVDTFGTPLLEAALDVVWGDDARRVVVDLTQVSFLSLSAVHALLRTRSIAQRRGTDLTLTTSSRFITRVLGLAGAGDVTVRRDCPDGPPTPPAGDPVADHDGRPRRAALSLVPEPMGLPVPVEWALPQTGPAVSGDVLLETLRGASGWTSTDDLQMAMESLGASAVATIPGAEGAGVLLQAPGPHDPDLRACTDCRAEGLDEVRQRLPWSLGDGRTGETAGTDDGVVVVDDLREDPRWPDLAAGAAVLGVRSVLCLRLGTARPIGTLTVYSSRPAAFSPAAQRLGQILAAVGSITLPAARRHHDLARALATRDVIGQAKGILMERHKITADQAFGVLQRASCVSNTKLRSVAERLTDTDEL
jgi:anti-anti-sigma factor